MQRMANQVMDHYRAGANAHCVPYKACQLLGTQMVGKQAATDNVEGAVLKGKCQGIGNHGSGIAVEVGAHAVEECELQCDPALRQFLANQSWHFVESGGNVQNREMLF